MDYSFQIEALGVKLVNLTYIVHVGVSTLLQLLLPSSGLILGTTQSLDMFFQGTCSLVIPQGTVH